MHTHIKCYTELTAGCYHENCIDMGILTANSSYRSYLILSEILKYALNQPVTNNNLQEHNIPALLTCSNPLLDFTSTSYQLQVMTIKLQTKHNHMQISLINANINKNCQYHCINKLLIQLPSTTFCLSISTYLRISIFVNSCSVAYNVPVPPQNKLFNITFNSTRLFICHHALF